MEKLLAKIGIKGNLRKNFCRNINYCLQRYDYLRTSVFPSGLL